MTRSFVPRIATISILLHVTSVHVAAYWIDKRVTVQPIVVRSTDGGQAANPQLKIFEAETDKIWAQAGMDFRFLPVVYFDNNLYTNVSTDIFQPNSFYSLAIDPGHAQNSDPKVINVWFVFSINGGTSAAGYSLQSSDNYGTLIERNGVSIANSAFAYSGGAGMRDIFAYEIGRNLGLNNGTLGASGDSKNLMKSGGPYPTSITNIYPDGLAFGHLTADQITMARRFSFAVNLPSNQQYAYPPPTTAPPRISVSKSPAGILVSWIDMTAEFSLQQLSLTNFALGNWQPVNAPVTTMNGNCQVLVPLNQAGQAFRLIRP